MPDQSRIYLDHAATTPIIPVARAAMAEAMVHWANPSSPHQEGRAARFALEAARRQIAAALNWDGEVILTSGASEAIALGLRGTAAVASTVEHDVVLAVAGPNRLPVGAGGQVDIGAITGAARFAVQSVNNETGIIQPLTEIARAVRDVGGIFFADCSQSAGKLPLPDADFARIRALAPERAANWKLVADERLALGECRVVTPQAEADVGCQQRLDACIDTLAEHLHLTEA